jgi:hypothetical protein
MVFLWFISEKGFPKQKSVQPNLAERFLSDLEFLTHVLTIVSRLQFFDI